MQPIHKQLIIDKLPGMINGHPDFEEFESLHAKWSKHGPIISAEISKNSPPFCDYAHMYPGHTLLLYIEDIGKIPSFDASVLDEWIFSHASSVILYTCAFGFLPARWQSVLTVKVHPIHFENVRRAKPNFKEQIRIWHRIGQKMQDLADRLLAEFVHRTSK